MFQDRLYDAHVEATRDLASTQDDLERLGDDRVDLIVLGVLDHLIADAADIETLAIGKRE